MPEPTQAEVAESIRLSADAGRSAAAMLRHLRAGNGQASLDLVATLSELERGYLAYALAAFANQALNMCDQLAEIAREHGAEVKATGDDVLTAITLGFPS